MHVLYRAFSHCDCQDGSVEDKIPSVDLFPVHHMDELEFFPGSFVIDAAGRLCVYSHVFDG